MRSTRVFAAVCALSLFVPFADGAAPAREKLDRGVVAVQSGEGKAYVSWRLLASDPADAAFNVYRVAAGKSTKLNAQPIRQTTDFVDPQAPAGEVAYSVRAVIAGQEEEASAAVQVAASNPSQPFVKIKLEGAYKFQKIGIADLDGDGRLDYVIKQPRDNIDPYEKYWKPSPDTYKLEAYSADGKFLWRYDLGWAIERGIWYSPYLVYDLDGDGKAEVAVKTGEGDPRDKDGRVQTGPEYLTILNGQTGKPIAQIDWPSRADFPSYNYASRNQLGVAYLDGKTPSLIVGRGTYNYMTVLAYEFRDGKLRPQWTWNNKGLPREFQGQGAHWMHCADVTGDGRDEVLLGSITLDGKGAVLWYTGLGHPDHFYLGDIDPSRPGLEIYFGIETGKKTGNGMCLADAKTGRLLWGIKEPTKHVHGQGMCSDIDPAHPGVECYSAESDPANGKSLAWALLHNCKGEVIGREPIGGFAPFAAYWDADLQRELVVKGAVRDFGSEKPIAKVEGDLIAVADVLGDWREELITSVNGELRIYVSAIPAKDRRVSLMQDPIYRNDVVHAAMGYYQVPMTSYSLTKP